MSDFKFNCPHCGAPISIDASGAGLTIACPHCAKNLLVPAPLPPGTSQARTNRAGSKAWLWCLIGGGIVAIAGVLVVYSHSRNAPSRVVVRYFEACAVKHWSSAMREVTASTAEAMTVLQAQLDQQPLPTNATVAALGERLEGNRAWVRFQLNVDGQVREHEVPLEKEKGRWKLDLIQDYFPAIVMKAPWTGAGPQALKLFAQAKQLGDTNGVVWGKLGLMLYDGAHDAEALEAFARAGNSGDVTWRFAGEVWQGHLLDLQPQRTEALKHYQAALSLSAKPATRHDQYGIVLNPEWVQARLQEPFQRKIYAVSPAPATPSGDRNGGNGPANRFSGRINVAQTMAKHRNIYVIPTHETNPAAQKAIHEYVQRVRNRFNPEAPMITDEEALSRNLSSNTVIAYGTLDGNAWLAKTTGLPPVKVEPGGITAGEKFAGEHLCFIAACPNPQNPASAVVIYTAQQADDIVGINSVFHGPTDYVVADGTNILKAANFNKSGSAWAFPARTPKTDSPAPAKASASERLKQVKALYEQGLISKEDYDKKVKEIMDAL